MDERRIHRYLDGELSLRDLTPEEQSQLEAYEAIIRHATTHGKAERFPRLAPRSSGPYGRSPASPTALTSISSNSTIDTSLRPPSSKSWS